MISLILEFICYQITKTFGLYEGVVILRSQLTMRKAKSCTWCSKSESEIIKQYSKQTGNIVQQCGFFVSKSHPFLGASPDGLIGRDGSIEVKKIHPRKGETLESALLRLHIIKRTDGCLSVNENHQYYYQMQQQLFCAERKWVDFVASDGYALFVKRVLLDHDFWSRNLPRQCNFVRAGISKSERWA